jgi:hypothetical protein
LLVLGDTPTGAANIHVVKESEETFEQVFGVPLDAALELGYRSGYSQLSISVDPRFWNEAAGPPGPDDLEHAIAALRKIYDGSAAVPAGGAADSSSNQPVDGTVEALPGEPAPADGPQAAGDQEEPTAEA